MKSKATRRPFNDPFDELSDEDFEREVLESLDQATTKISLRVPKALLGRTNLDVSLLGVSFGVILMLLLSGLFYFRRMERSFADVV